METWIGTSSILRSRRSSSTCGIVATTRAGRASVQPAVVKNDLPALAAILADREKWSNVPEDLFKRRAAFAKEAAAKAKRLPARQQISLHAISIDRRNWEAGFLRLPNRTPDLGNLSTHLLNSSRITAPQPTPGLSSQHV